MKKTLFFCISCLLGTCSSPIKANYKHEHYVKHIDFENINTISDVSFYIYYHSPKCSYSNSINEEMIDFAQNRNVYFVNVLGVTKTCVLPDQSDEEIGCVKGTPTLRFIYHHEIKMTLIGVDMIKSFLMTST